MNERTIITACVEIVKGIGTAITEKTQQLQINNGGTSDFYFCLGGSVARLIQRLEKGISSSGNPESFLEGFSSYLRYAKEIREEGGGNKDVTPRLLWLIDKDTPNN